MLSFRNIYIVSKYDSLILWRNWFFKIFVFGVTIFLTFFNVFAFSKVNDRYPWVHHAFSSGQVYANMFLLNTIQAAVVIFLATEIIKNNKKLDTNEVFYVRSVSNAELVIGKAFAIFKLFFILNCVILIIALFVNSFAVDSAINIKAYFIYPMLISAPTIFFSTSLAFLTVSILKNQAVSIIILIAMFGTYLIYLQNIYYYSFDFLAVHIPILSSDIVGFTNLSTIVMQRAYFVLLGISFFFGSIFFLNRLPQRRINRSITLIIGLLFLGLAVGVINNYIGQFKSQDQLRTDSILLNGKFAAIPNASIHTCKIDLTHANDNIEVNATLSLVNHNDQPIDSVYFLLNPSLSISSLQSDNMDLSFQRLGHICYFKLPNPISPEESINIELSYQGNIDQSIAHLDITPDKYHDNRNTFFFNIDKQAAILTENYVLLTREVLWYPTMEVGYNEVSSFQNMSNFVNFELDVTTTESLTAISQGRQASSAPGKFHFKPEFEIPQISLVIGDYSQLNIAVDSIAFQLYIAGNNPYFTKYFEELSDTLPSLISDLKNGYEVEQNLKYPFKRLQLIETPVQFHSYYNLYRANSYTQPETIFIPEHGGLLRELDLKRQFRIVDNQAKQGNSLLSDRQKQADVFSFLVKSLITKQNLGSQNSFDTRDSRIDLNIFSNLYDYSTNIYSKDWPLIKVYLSRYLNKRHSDYDEWTRNWRGITFDESCNIIMQEKTLDEIIGKEKDPEKIRKIVEMKGEFLLAYLSEKIGRERFDPLVFEIIADHQHESLSLKRLQTIILEKSGTDIQPIIQQLYNFQDLPAFELSDLQHYQVREGNKNKFQIRLKIENIENVEGIVAVDFQYPDGSRSNDNKTAQFYIIPKNTVKELHFLVDEKPNRISVNTLISKNIPSKINLALNKFEIKNNQTPFQGMTDIQKERSLIAQEIIVDNEDKGFSTSTPFKEPVIKEFVNGLKQKEEDDLKYYGIWRRSSIDWRLTTGSVYFGQYIRSAHFTTAGNGEKIATWEANIKENSFYDLYVYLSGEAHYSNNGGDRQNIFYRYEIEHDDGIDKAAIDITKSVNGWNYIGTYYFSNGAGKVRLTDQTEDRAIFADAVKWVKQQ